MSGERPTPTSGRWGNTASMPRRNDSPRRVRNGIKLQSKLPLEPRGVVAGKWLRLIESRLPQGELALGLEYAKAGQIVSMDVRPGTIAAQVQGMAFRPHQVELRLNTLSPEQWTTLIDLMSREAIHVANLLAGEMPPAIDTVFADAGVPLFEAADAVRFQCDCGLDGPCRHAAAVGYLMTEHLDAVPLQIFTLQGLAAEKVLDRLRHARLQQGRGHHGGGHTHGLAAPVMAEAPPLEACMDEFWHAASGAQSSRMETEQAVSHAPHALLRRLGPSPMQGRFPMVGLLASIYDSVSATARTLRGDAASDQSLDRQPE